MLRENAWRYFVVVLPRRWREPKPSKEAIESRKSSQSLKLSSPRGKPSVVGGNMPPYPTQSQTVFILIYIVRHGWRNRCGFAIRRGLTDFATRDAVPTFLRL